MSQLVSTEFAHLSFRLSDEFITPYASRPVAFGFDIGGGNSLGELTFYSKYSLRKSDGSKERWYECCRRVVEGVYSILKNACMLNRTPWSHVRAQRAAEDMYERMFVFKWLPPGRGLFKMGTPFVFEEGSASLQNCGFLSTEKLGLRNPTLPFVRMMEMSMLGIGVGFDTAGAGKLTICEPTKQPPLVYVITDDREGWCKSVDLLLHSYLLPNQQPVKFDYSLIRKAGTPIVRFGGTAAGPGHLRALHDKLRAHLDAQAGQLLSVRMITDIMNLIGKCVVAGNVRRSAQIAFGEPGDDEFLNLKNWDLNPERMGPDGWGSLSNNSVFGQVGMDLAHLAGPIGMNGEPGIFYRDLARGWGRLKDIRNDRDFRVAGANPCQPGWASVLTPVGLSTVGALQAGDQIWSETGWTTVTRKWSTGQQDVHRYRTNAGVFYGTKSHRLVSRGVKTEAQRCASVDSLNGPSVDVDTWDPQDIMDGLVLGDGSVHMASNNLVFLLVGTDDQDYLTSEVAPLLVKNRPGLSPTAWEITTTVTAVEVPKTYERCVPDRFMQAAPIRVAGFLRGLYSANGSVVAHGRRVTLKSSSPKLVEQVQILLSSLGIRSHITRNRAHSVEFSNGSYECRESYDVNITVDRDRFAWAIGFLQDYKMEKLKPSSGPGHAKKTYNITSAAWVSTEEVFDITVSNSTHTYWTGGVNVSNCVEQPLEDNELCTLVETFPFKHESLEDYKRTLKVAYLYGKCVTVLPTHWPESNEVMHRNRRIGLSMSGIVQFVESRGVAELRRWCDEGYAEVHKRDVQYSEWLGVRESIKTTSVKPSGTVSLLVGATPGVHWPPGGGTGDTYIRRQRFSVNDPLIGILQAAGYHAEPDVQHPDADMVVEFPTRGPKVRSERDVSVWEKVALASVMQEEWADNMVSATFTFTPEEEGQIAPIISMSQGRLKAMSFLPLGPASSKGAYPQMPYEGMTEEQYTTSCESKKRLDIKSMYANGAEAEGEQFCSNDTCEIRRAA